MANKHLNLNFENLELYNEDTGSGDTGLSALQKWQRNFEKVALALQELLDTINFEELDKHYLRKDIEDTAAEIITFLKGLKVGQNGSRISVLEDGTTEAVVDRLYVRIKAIFEELEVHKKTYVGGSQILSPSGMKCIKVDEMADAWRCYMKAEEDGVEVHNTFSVGTLALMKECNVKVGVSHKAGNRYFWREVIRVGADWIDVSKTSCDKFIENDAPAVGDDIIGLGHKSDIGRQGAIAMSSVDDDAPCIVFYQGINDFSLTDKDVISMNYDKATGHAKLTVYGEFYVGDRTKNNFIKYSPTEGVEVKGKLHIEKGSTGWEKLEGLPESIQSAVDSVQSGAVNLLLNSGFTGNYESEDLTPGSKLEPGTEMYSKATKDWTGSVTIVEDAEAVSGRAAQIGSLSQNVKLLKGESYVFSCKAKGANITLSCGSFNASAALTETYQKIVQKFQFDGANVLMLSGTATVCDVQLERGTIATDWHPSPYDNDKTAAKFQSINYIMSAIKDGSVDVLGGLVLANMMQLGNYKDGRMQEVTAGISGIFNAKDDVAFWAGGTFEQAIRTVMKFRENTRYQPTEEEWSQLANFVATHGGDLFIRGYIYALGGLFRGRFESSVDGKRVVIDPETGYFQMYNEKNQLAISVQFAADTVSENVSSLGDIEMYKYNGSAINTIVSINPYSYKKYDFKNKQGVSIDEKEISFFQIIGDAAPVMEDVQAGMTAKSVGITTLTKISLGVDVVDNSNKKEFRALLHAGQWPTQAEARVGGVYLDGDILKVKQNK